MQKIIAITGLKRSGKDTIANYLRDNYGYTIFRFAEPIKKVIILLMEYANISKDDIENYLEFDKEVVIPELNASYRQLAQTLGTEWGREQIDQDFWVNLLNFTIKDNDKVVISDLRFESEVDFIKTKKSYIIKVYRGDDEIKDEHISEQGIDDGHINYFIDNNSSLDYLYIQADSVMTILGEKKL